MKLHTSVLEKFIELPSKDPKELRALLDDVGLEVKGIEEKGTDTVFTIETLANRGDHVSANGIARELSARLLCGTLSPASKQLGEQKSQIIVRKNTEFCMRYSLLEMTAPADMRLQDDLAAILDSDHKKHAMVDILQYVQLEYGQPMHVFDKEKVDSEIVIELTNAPEKIEALDGKTYTVPADSIVIKDRKKIIAVAGVIGCANSMVDKTSTRVLIESASFDPIKVRKTARAMGLATDASHNFERGCDVEMVLPALRRVAYLTQDGSSNSAQIVGIKSVDGEPLEKRKIEVRLKTLKEQINLPRIAESEIFSRLKKLGFHIEYDEANKAKTFLVEVPSWRLWDVKNEEDIFEDFARSHGLSNVKQKLPDLDYEQPAANPQDKLLATIEGSLVGAGFYEVITKSLYSADDAAFVEKLSPHFSGKHVQLKNSIESSFSHVRVTNILHTASLVAQNIKMGVSSVKVFELGRVFQKDPLAIANPPLEIEELTIAAAGRWYEGSWRQPESREELFYLVKGTVENLLQSLHRQIDIRAAKNPFFHPGMQGEIYSGKTRLGTIGVLHPEVLRRYDLKSDVVMAVLDGGELLKSVSDTSHGFSAPIDLPMIRRDVTMVTDANFLAGEVIRVVQKENIANLIDIRLVDDFKKPGERDRRVTYRCTFQHSERTLESKEVDDAFATLLTMLAEKLKISPFSGNA